MELFIPALMKRVFSLGAWPNELLSVSTHRFNIIWIRRLISLAFFLIRLNSI